MRRLSNVVLAASVIVSSINATTEAKAWHHHGCGIGASYLSTWGAYGMGGGFRQAGFGNCYTPSYASYSYYQPQYVSYYRPIVFAPRVRSALYWPTTCWQTPAYVANLYSCSPSYSIPSYYPSWNYSNYYPTYFYGSYNSCFSYSPTSVQSPAIANHFPSDPALRLRFALSQSNRVGANQVKVGVGSVLLPDTSTTAANRQTKFVSLKPTTDLRNPPPVEQAAQPSESWVVLAVEMIDSMAQQGGVHEGLASCEQLVRVKQSLPSEVYWRAAILASLAGRDSKQVAQYVEQAEQAPGHFSPSLLPGGSLRGYVKRIPGQTLDKALDRHARTALTDSRPTDAYRVLATFLRQDGQSQRAEKFALAARKALPAVSTADTSNVLLTATEAKIEPR